EVNETFADTIAEFAQPGDTVWAHDYHLLLVGRALRNRGYRGALAHFLHIPFPPLDVLAILPWADVLLDGLLAFDLVGFHTPGYVSNFLRACAVRLGAVISDDAVELRGRRTRVGAFPIGIFPGGFQEPSEPE